MTRVINADELLKAYEGRNNFLGAVLMGAPTIDIVPVIRCRDCKWHKEKRCTVWRERAVIVECYTDDDGFCYLGEPND